MRILVERRDKGNRLTPPDSQTDLFDVTPHVGFAGCGQLSEDWTIVQTSSGRRCRLPEVEAASRRGRPVACFWIRRQKIRRRGIRRRETCRQQTRRQKRHWICQRSNLLPALDYLPMIILQSL